MLEKYLCVEGEKCRKKAIIELTCIKMIEDVGWKRRIKIWAILRSVVKRTMINHKQWHCLLFTGKYFLIGS